MFKNFRSCVLKIYQPRQDQLYFRLRHSSIRGYPRLQHANCNRTTSQTMSELFLNRADDMHHHLRDGSALELTVPHCARQFERAIVMPNLTPPVTTTDLATAYRERILSHVPADCCFQPLMTLYLTDKTRPEEIRKAKESGIVFAVKYYPAGATTNSEFGVTDITKVYDTLAEMAKVGMPLLVHGEVTDQSVDIFDREAKFIELQLRPLVSKFEDLKVVMEHITTEDAVEFVLQSSANVAATITCHHLLYNRNAIFQKGVNPHKYCLPVLKRERHRQALLRAIKSGSKKFFLGTDSAPHPKERKEASCGCAGIYTGHAALELYAEAFDSVGCLENLKGFACENGADFYGLSRNSTPIRLVKEAWRVPQTYPFAGTSLVPLRAEEEIQWKLCK